MSDNVTCFFYLGKLLLLLLKSQHVSLALFDVPRYIEVSLVAFGGDLPLKYKNVRCIYFRINLFIADVKSIICHALTTFKLIDAMNYLAP